MGNEVIKLTYSDMELIHGKATTARSTNDDALNQNCAFRIDPRWCIWSNV